MDKKILIGVILGILIFGLPRYGLTAEESPSASIKIELKDGSVIVGNIQEPLEISVKTKYGKLKIEIKDIISVSSDEIRMRDGSAFKGKVEIGQVKVQSIWCDQLLEIKEEYINSIRFITELKEKLTSTQIKEPTPKALGELTQKIKDEIAKGLTDEELRELVIRLSLTRETQRQLAKELTRKEFDELLWGMKWAQEPPPEYTKHRVDDPKKYDVQGLRVNADFQIDLSEWWPDKVEEGTYWVPAAKLGTPNTTKEELSQLKGQPEKAKKEIDNLFEALAFMHLCLSPGRGNIKVKGRHGTTWELPKPAELAIREGKVNCASAANVIYYLLEDDYDEVGCVWRHSSFEPEVRPGGHCTSYIKENGKYYFLDPVSLAETRSHYPVEDGDGHFYHADICDLIIQSTPRNYAIFWTHLSRNDEAIFAMWPGPGFALGRKGSNFYYPKAFDDSNLTIWKDPADSVELLKANYDPRPPRKYSKYEPYKDYGKIKAAKKGEPQREIMPSDD